jgi:hypothetical protein
LAIALVAGCGSAGVVAPTGPSADKGPDESSFATIPEPPTAAPPSSASASASSSASVSSIDASTETSSALAIVPPQPACTPQPPLEFLVRANYIPVKSKKKEFQKTLLWRTKEYGYVKGWGEKKWNPSLAKDHAVDIKLFGLPVRVHERVVPALRCAEQEIVKSCAATPYTPGVLAGLRAKNTYKGGEVTNHLWGIAVDVDPKLNPCCGCTKTKSSAVCKKKVSDEFERMAMPKCWVDAFEKYGFYWLGHDTLKDTMHFEFLGDPDKVMKTPAGAASVATKGSATPLPAALPEVGEEMEEEE